LPVLVTRNSPIPELLGDGALAVDPDRTEEIYRSMVLLLEDRELRGRMGSAARVASESLNWEQAARALLRVIEGAAGR
jgi:glycosyltransferase involved in cell wall biosynthesis